MWNKLDMTVIQKNATETWGDKSWTVTDVKQIEAFSVARGEQNAPLAGAAAGIINLEGKKAFQKRQRSRYLAHHALGLLSDNGRAAIMVHESMFEWFDDFTGESVYDGLTVLFLILLRLRHDATMVNIFKELEAIQKLHIKDFGNNLTNYLTAMEAK